MELPWQGRLAGRSPARPNEQNGARATRPDGDLAGWRRADCRRRGRSARARGQSDVAAMIHVPAGVRVWLVTGCTDMRKCRP